MEKPPPEVVAEGQGYPPPQTHYPQAGGAPPPQTGYEQPQAGYPPSQAAPPPASNTTIVMANTQPATTTSPTRYGEQSVSMTCTNCRAQIVTRKRPEVGLFAILLAVVLCLIGCWPCCLIPLFVDQCKDVHHECPNCNVELGAFKRL